MLLGGPTVEWGESMAERMLVWIFQTGEPMPLDGDEARPMRAMNLTDALVGAGHEVVLWTADFDHTNHRHRYGSHTKVRVSDLLEVRFIHSRGYASNIGVARLADHAQLAISLRRLLKGESHPDVAFVGYPPIEPATVMVDWLRGRDVPVMLDIKDAWPEVLLRGVPMYLKPLGHLALSPYSLLMHRAFQQASGLTSTAEPFLNWSLETAGRDRNSADRVFPLTSRRPDFPDDDLDDAGVWWDERGVIDDGRFRIFFVGTLHSSYDFTPVAEAAQDVDVQVVICGDGSSASDIRAEMTGLPNVVLPGWVTAQQAEVLGRRSTLALAPIAPHPDFAMSVPNKFYDAMSKGLPIVTSLTGAAGELVESHNIGRVYGGRWKPSLRTVLAELEGAPDEISAMSRNALDLYSSEYSYETVYGSAVRHLESLASRNLR